MATDDQGDWGTGQGLKERARQSAEANAYVTQRDHPPEPEKPAYVAPKGDPDNPKTRYGAHPERGEKRIDVSSWMKRLPTQEKTPVYDQGGKVNVNDGKHQVAILKDGERVLTPEQNKDWEHAKDLGGVSGKAPTTLPIGGKTVRDSNDVTPDMTPKKVYDKGGVVHSEHSPEERAHFHRSMSSLHTGGLHRALGVSEDKPLSMEQKKHAAASSNPHMAAMGRLAVAMHGWKPPKAK
jgi:hypothetical protein